MIYNGSGNYSRKYQFFLIIQYKWGAYGNKTAPRREPAAFIQCPDGTTGGVYLPAVSHFGK